jgi:hypothetical protein
MISDTDQTNVDPLEQDLSKLDAAVRQELARQARSRRYVWGLLAFAFIVAIVVLRVGQTERDALSADIGGNAKFATSVATAIVSEPVVAEALVNSESVRNFVATEAASFAQSDEFLGMLISSEAVGANIDESSRKAVTVFMDEPEFATAVRGAVGATTPGLESDVEANLEAIRHLENRLDSISVGPMFGTRFNAIEREQARITESMGAQPSINETLFADVKRLQQSVADLEARFKESTRTIETLRDSKTRTPGSRSYLLKENASNALSDAGLIVTLGAEMDGRITSVSVEDAAGPVQLSMSTEIKLGQPFEFSDNTGRRFRAIFPYTQSRFWARDFVGLELEVLDTD